MLSLYELERETSSDVPQISLVSVGFDQVHFGAVSKETPPNNSTFVCIIWPMLSIAALILIHSVISWEMMAGITGVDKCDYPAGMGGARKEIDAHGLSTMHDIYGASCLAIGLPITTFVPLYYSGVAATVPHAQVGLALGLSLYELWVCIWSFFGDYYFQSVCQETTPEIGTKPAEGEYAWWQKAMICNKIDVFFASFNMAVWICVMLAWLLYNAGPVSKDYKPVMVLCLVVSISCKFAAASKYSQYDEDKSADNLWWAMFLHTIWHLASVVCTHNCIYELMTNGLNFNKYTDSCSEEDTDEICIV